MAIPSDLLRTTNVLHLHHGWRASPWRMLWLLLPLLPLLVAIFSNAFAHNQGGYFVLAGTIVLVPAAWAMMMEGWTGAFTCTSIVSLFAYIIYCNAPIIFGDALTALSAEDFPVIGMSVRPEAAQINVYGCIALAAGLMLGYRPPKPVSTQTYLKPSKLHVPDDVLRNSIVVIISSFILVRMYIIYESGGSLFEFLGQGRAAGDYLEMAGSLGFIVSLASVFQVTAVIGGALLLARRSKVPLATLVALMGIAVPIMERMLRGGRGQVIGYVLALMAFAVTIPIPRVRAAAFKALPIVMIAGVLGFAAMSVFRTSGVSGTSDASLSKGLQELIEYDQFTALEQCVYVFPRIHDTLKGETLIALPTNPVPRAVWPDKPRGLGTVLPAILKDRVSLTLSAGLIGEGWANFLETGAILLPFFVGFFAALWDRLRNVGSRWSDGYAMWAAGIPGLFFIVRGSFMIGGTFIMYSVIGMVMMLIVSGRFKANDQP